MMFRKKTITGRLGFRPLLDCLESRELLSMVAAPLEPASELAAARARHVPVINQLAHGKSQVASTIPANGDLNPYGVAFVPSGFATGGVLNPGDLLVSNFNNSKNLQGTGTTIIRITPANQTSVFYQGPPGQGPPGVGLSTALGVLQSGYVIVGTVPSTDGTSATATSGELLVLDKNGKEVTTISDPSLLNGPWDLTVNDMGSTAQLFVANVLSGTVTRLNVSITPQNGFQVTSKTQIASGYIHRGDPAAFEIGPTGLAYNAATGTLYVASTGDNKVYAVANAGSTTSDGGTGTVVYKDNRHLHGPLGLTFVGDGNLVAAQGDAVNPSKRQPSELVEFTPRGKFVGQFSINKKPDGAFGVASTADGTRFAAVNDNTNTVRTWSIKL